LIQWLSQEDLSQDSQSQTLGTLCLIIAL